MASGSIANVESGRYNLRTREKSGRSGGAAKGSGIVKREKSRKGGNRANVSRERTDTKPLEPSQRILTGQQTVRKRKAVEDAAEEVISEPGRKRQRTPEQLPPTPNSEKRKTTRGRSQRSVTPIHSHDTRTTRKLRDYTTSPTREASLGRNQTPSSSNDVSQSMEETTLQIPGPRSSNIPLQSASTAPSSLEGVNTDDTNGIMQRPALEPPFEYTPPIAIRHVNQDLSHETEAQLPEPPPAEPEFARLLEYPRPSNSPNSGAHSLDILAVAAAQSSNESLNTLSETRVLDTTHETTGNTNQAQGVSESIQEISPGDLDNLDMQEIIPGLFLGS
jgi:hypothetical protein